MAEPFDPNLSVGREDILNKIEKWANEDKSPRRLLSIVGPPGIGKSWLMAYVRERLEQAGHLVFWADLSRGAIDPRTGRLAPDLTTNAGISEWFRLVVTQAQQMSRLFEAGLVHQKGACIVIW